MVNTNLLITEAMMHITFLIGHMVKERDLILYELAEDLGKNGANVTVISGYPSRRISDKVRNYYLNHPKEMISKNVESIRVGSKKGEGNGLLIRMVKYVALSFAIIRKALSIETDVYYIYSTPPFLAYFAKPLNRKAPVVYNAQDLFPDSLKTAKGYKEQHILIKLFRKFERMVYLHSNKIVTISEDMKNHIIELGCDEKKIEVINNWADTEKIIPIQAKDNSLAREYAIDLNKFTVLYAGDIGYHQRLDVFVEVAKLIENENFDIQFVFFGNGMYESSLRAAIKDNGLNNFHVLPFQPIERISEVYSIGDIDIVSLEPGMTKLALPSKVWSVMSAGRPILAMMDKESEISKFINNKYGYVVDGMSNRELADLIISLICKKNSLEEMGNSARAFVVNDNSRTSQTTAYFDVLKEVAANKIR